MPRRVMWNRLKIKRLERGILLGLTCPNTPGSTGQVRVSWPVTHGKTVAALNPSAECFHEVIES